MDNTHGTHARADAHYKQNRIMALMAHPVFLIALITTSPLSVAFLCNCIFRA